MIFVIDASVAVNWLLKEETHPHAERVLEKLIEAPESFAVPELFGFEVFSVLQRTHTNGLGAFIRGIVPILQSGILRQPMTEELASDAELFLQRGLTGYDACYASLAKSLEGQWLTFDKKAHNAIKDTGVSCFLRDTLPEALNYGLRNAIKVGQGNLSENIKQAREQRASKHK